VSSSPPVDRPRWDGAVSAGLGAGFGYVLFRAAVNFWTTCEPISPVPPTTVNFTSLPSPALHGGLLGRGLAPPGNALLMAMIMLTFVIAPPGRVLGVDSALRTKLPRWMV